tara:strand:- start:10 stop:291 length:282 start_codon:yes stop_codon:yes gene_type:complete
MLFEIERGLIPKIAQNLDAESKQNLNSMGKKWRGDIADGGVINQVSRIQKIENKLARIKALKADLAGIEDRHPDFVGAIAEVEASIAAEAAAT